MAYRAIEDTVGTSRTLAQLSDFAERLFWRMLAVSDACGRLTGDPTKIRVLCIPLLDERDDDAVRVALEELVRADRIELYCTRGEWACQITRFDAHQPRQFVARLRHSRWPAPPRDAAPDDGQPRDAVPAMADADPSPDADSGKQVRADSGPESRPDQKRGEHPPEQALAHQPARAREAVSALVDSSLSSAHQHEAGRDLGKLLAVLPDADRNTAKVLHEIFDDLPPQFVGLAIEELRVAENVRRPTAYVVRIGQRMLEQQRRKREAAV